MTGLHLRTTGMGFASEMIVRASLAKLRIGEVPTTLRPDRRGGRMPLLDAMLVLQRQPPG